jgi:hypothetical protein
MLELRLGFAINGLISAPGDIPMPAPIMVNEPIVK